MGNFTTFCRGENKLTENKIGEVIVILFLFAARDFCDASCISIIHYYGKKINVECISHWEKTCGRSGEEPMSLGW